MCICAPARIVKIDENNAMVDFGGVKNQAKLDLVGDLDVGTMYLYTLDMQSRYGVMEKLKNPSKHGQIF